MAGVAAREVVVPVAWRQFYDDTGIPAAVWSGTTLRLTGHTGEDEHGVYPTGAEEQIRGTFRNVALTLDAAGTSWDDVVELHSYHVGLAAQAEAVLRIAAEFLDRPYPAWTAVGVVELFLPEALVEISCVAVVADRGR